MNFLDGTATQTFESQGSHFTYQKRAGDRTYLKRELEGGVGERESEGPKRTNKREIRKMSGGDAAGVNSTPVLSVCWEEDKTVVQQVLSEMKCR